MADKRRDGPLGVMSLNVLHGFPRFRRLSERLDRIAARSLRYSQIMACCGKIVYVQVQIPLTITDVDRRLVL